MVGTYTSSIKILHCSRPVLRQTYIQDYCMLFENFKLSCRVRLDLYCSTNIVRVIKSRRMRWVGHIARMGKRSGVYRILVGSPEGNRPIGRHNRKWEVNIKMDLRKGMWGYGLECVECESV
jgi:hypothetical protein